MIGATISRYKITEWLGEGGQAKVYKAEDLHLRRNVALKVLSSQALGDEEQRVRFFREGQAAARLDHPNVAQIHDIGEQDGHGFIAMAFVDGSSLAAKIEAAKNKERHLRLDEALDIAIQICEGLKEAHAKSVIHRDIKPANIMLTRQGDVKITDFGLAHLADRSKLTIEGARAGTPAYMSPEQANTEPTDSRTDIWGVGVVLYEMIAGKRAFENDFEQAVIYSIINEQPEPLTAFRTGLPTELDRVVSKALAKRPDERYQHVDDFLVDLRRLRKSDAPEAKSPTIRPEPLAAPVAPHELAIAPQPVAEQETETLTSGPRPPTPPPAPAWKTLLPWALFAAMAIRWLVPPSETPPQVEPPPGPTRRFAFHPSEPVRSSPFNRDVAVSPNGQHIAFARDGPNGKLWVQDLDQWEPRTIEGTEGAFEPFWSPDSSLIGFAAGSELRKVPVQGGTSARICSLSESLYGAAWSPDGEVIVFASGNPPVLYEVPAGGGTASVLLSPKDMESTQGETAAESSFGYPCYLPREAGAPLLLFSFGNLSTMRLFVQDLESGARESFGTGVKHAYSSSGHVVYQASHTAYELWAQPFSLSDHKPTGEPFLLSENSRSPTVSTDGTLVYLDHVPEVRELVVRDRGGILVERMGDPVEDPWEVVLSPDGRRVAFSAGQDFNRDVWFYDRPRNLTQRLTRVPAIDYSPVWSPQGDAIAFTSDRLGRDHDILVQRLDASGEPEVLVSTTVREVAGDWSHDGTYLIYRRMDPQTRADLWYLVRDGRDWTPHVFLQTPASEGGPQFSPDGHHVAYVSDQSGRHEVYVRAFPQGGDEIRISRNGGIAPRWNLSGGELFYVEGNSLIAVPVSANPNFSASNPTRLFDSASLNPEGQAYAAPYDVSADGQRFILFEPAGEQPAPAIRVVENWYEEFRGRGN